MKLSVLSVSAVALLGVAGLMRGAVPASHAASSASDDMAGMQMSSTAASGQAEHVSGGSADPSGPMRITRAYVQQPASPDVAAAYFSVTNLTDTSDTVVSVQTSAAAQTALHTGADMDVASSGLVVPPHQTVALSVGHGHVMLTQLIGTLTPGQRVQLVLHFAHATTVTVSAPVIAIGADTP